MTDPAPQSDERSAGERRAFAEQPHNAERLVRALEAHAAAESADAAEYERLTDAIDDPVIRHLLSFILTDARHHDETLRSMIRCLGHATAESPSEGGDLAMPSNHLLDEATVAFAAQVRTLIRDEHEGARYVRHLARQEPQLYRGYFPLLLEIIARDAEKHVTILRFVLRLLEKPC